MARRDYRIARVQVGDSLQRIALRELGTAGRWSELVYLNDLRAPYIVPTQADAADNPGALWWGMEIKIPAVGAASSAVSDEDLFGRDIDLGRGDIQVSNGDIAVLAGVPNLSQAIRHRLATAPSELLYHPEYGCQVRVVLGERNDEIRAILAGGFVKRALQQEPRLQSVPTVRVETREDRMDIDCTVVPVITNTPIDLNLVFPVET